ncbi:protein-tyrosine sulfotransferase-like isoform X2 [Mangifera indica]|uniref:protein-tyrosine sulfotransferase-like isoform X2 n=1 Tax=Mangifera indica TaxID=29780 RepID=UPI001CFB3FCE|nr:protein-tyrosine sulfotransferase-like isoform X2 [Mangifera indica]
MSTRSRNSIQLRICFAVIAVKIIPMDTALKFTLLLLLLRFVNASTKNDFRHCERIVKTWALSSIDQEVKEDKHILQDLLFFLHVPRTGGRTYFHCLLRKLYSSSLECPRSYDKLRFDPGKTNCRLLVTHDDYSMMSKLPKEKTSVVTILRNPIDRVFSTYEFSVEVAARFLVHPNLTSATRMAKRLRSKSSGVSTLDIWPWKYLVPWMREDLFARRDARKQKVNVDVSGNDPYYMEDFVMPLQDFINKPTAWDIVHNGATFQVVGLTNNSFLAESHEVRHCVQKFKTLGDYVLQVAKKRLDEMLYIGLTENHRESANIFGRVVGAQVISQMAASNSSIEGSNKSEHSSSLSDIKPASNYHQNSTPDQKSANVTSAEKVEILKENMTVGKLMQDYEVCISSLRKSQATRRINSLKRISPVNFSKEARLQVPEEVLEQIRSLNSLDLELYEYALDIFAKQKQKLALTGKLDSILSHSYGITLWQGLLMGISIFLLVFFLLFINARRRTPKVKI